MNHRNFPKALSVRSLSRSTCVSLKWREEIEFRNKTTPNLACFANFLNYTEFVISAAHLLNVIHTSNLFVVLYIPAYIIKLHWLC